MASEETAAPANVAGESPIKRSWVQAREMSHQLVLQAALEDLEAKAVNLRQERDDFKAQSENREEQIGTLQAQVRELQKQMSGKDNELFETQQGFKARLDKAKILEDDNTNKSERADRVEQEADSLREEISRLTKTNVDLKEQIVAMATDKKLEESEVVPLKYQLQRLQSEIDATTAHSKWLEAELQTRNELLTDLRTSQAMELAELRANQDNANSEKEDTLAELHIVSAQNDDLKAKLDRLSTELRDTRQTAADDKRALEEELHAERHLVSNQAEQLARLRQRHDEVVKQMESLQSMTSDAEQEFQSNMSSRAHEFEQETKHMLEAQATDYKNQITVFEQKLAAANRRAAQAEDGLLLAAPASERNSKRLLAISQGANESSETDEPIGLTDLYARLAQTEDELSAERLKRKKAEIRFARIEKEIEANAPLLIRQRQEYEIALDRQEEYKQRMDDALVEMKAARDEAGEVRSELVDLHNRNRVLEKESTELAKQVQLLLVSRTGDANADESQEIPTSVAQMQSQNQRLLREHSRMEQAIADLQEKLSNDMTQAKLEAAEHNLTILQEDRKRQEVLVQSIVQQRDLYRALLNKHDSSLLGEEKEDVTALSVVRKQSERTHALEDKCGTLASELESARAELAAIVRDKEIGSERLARYESHTTELTSSLERLESQFLASKAEIARAEADSAFHREKCGSLEQSLERARSENARLTSSKDQLQTLSSDLQKAVAKASTDVGRLESELSQAASKLRMMEAQLESAKAGERRAIDSSDALRRDLSRQGTLLESVQKIEASLAAKGAGEKDSLQGQLDVAKQRLATADTRSSSKIEELNSTIQNLEYQIKELNESTAKANKEASQASEDADRVREELKQRSTKFMELAAQLRSAKQKLGETEDIDDSGVDLQGQIDTLKQELESSTLEILKLKERAAMYQKLAKTSETSVQDAKRVLDDGEVQHSKKISSLESQLQNAQQESHSRQEIIAKLTEDLAGHRGEQQKLVTSLQTQIATLQEANLQYQKESEAANTRYESLKQDIQTLSADLSAAQDHYERELALHATARTELRSTREEAEKQVNLRRSAEEQLQILEKSVGERESLIQTEKETLASSLAETEKTLELIRSQNDVLHKQLATLGEQAEQDQAVKINALTQEDASQPPGEHNDETGLLRKTISELREIIKFLRADKDMIQSSLDSSRRAVERERAAAVVLRRSLDEARSELAVLQGKIESNNLDTAPSKLNALSNKLKDTEEKARLLNDSNKMLRDENNRFQTSLAALQNELATLQQSSQPMETKHRQLETEKAVLLSEKASLERELEDWKGRVKSLVSKFNQVDPAEHAEALKRVKELEEEISSINAKKAQAEQESMRIRGLAQRASKELVQHKKLVEEQKKAIEKVTTERDSAAKASVLDQAAAKKLDDAKAKVEKLEAERKSEKLQLDGANERNDKLRVMLRTFQKQIADLKKKESSLSASLKETQDEVKKKGKEIETLSTANVANIPPVTQDTDASKEESKVEKSQQPPQELPATVTAAAAAKLPVEAPKTIRETPKVPAGGFNFGPNDDVSGDMQSIHPVEKPVPTTKPAQTMKKRPMEEGNQDHEPGTKKRLPEEADTSAVATTAASDKSADAPDPSKAVFQRRVSGEKQELSMKEKLLGLREKKRKLALAMQKAEEKKKAEARTEVEAEPAAKRSKATDDTTAEDPQNVEGATDGLAASQTTNAPEAPEPIQKVESSAKQETEATSEHKTAGLPASHAEADSCDNSKLQDTAAGVSQQQSTGFSFGQPAKSFGTSVPSDTVKSSSSILFGSVGQAPKTADDQSKMGLGGAFLDIKPPGSSSNTPQFTFGNSASIILPTPAQKSPQSQMFSAFAKAPGGAFTKGGVTATPLFTQKAVEQKEATEVEENQNMETDTEK